jgi:hypothetical protein
MSKSPITALERAQSNGSMDPDFIPSELRESRGSALTVTPGERHKYNNAYSKASKSRKKKHIARHLRRKTARRAERKRKVIESRRVVDKPKPVVHRYTPLNTVDPYMLLDRNQKIEEASKRRRDHGTAVRKLLYNDPRL